MAKIIRSKWFEMIWDVECILCRLVHGIKRPWGFLTLTKTCFYKSTKYHTFTWFDFIQIKHSWITLVTNLLLSKSQKNVFFKQVSFESFIFGLLVNLRLKFWSLSPLFFNHKKWIFLCSLFIFDIKNMHRKKIF